MYVAAVLNGYCVSCGHRPEADKCDCDVCMPPEQLYDGLAWEELGAPVG